LNVKIDRKNKTFTITGRWDEDGQVSTSGKTLLHANSHGHTGVAIDGLEGAKLNLTVTTPNR